MTDMPVQDVTVQAEGSVTPPAAPDPSAVEGWHIGDLVTQTGHGPEDGGRVYAIVELAPEGRASVLCRSVTPEDGTVQELNPRKLTRKDTE